MRLTELKPEWRENPPGNKYLHFKCPTCTEKGYYCLITVAVDNTHFPDCWKLESEPDFNVLTLSPSLAHQCKTNPHFFIRNGEIQLV